MEIPPPPPPSRPSVSINVGSDGAEIEPPNGVLNRHSRPTSLMENVTEISQLSRVSML